MDTDDVGEISSFATQPHEKGLLTLYQEQWTQFPIDQNLHPQKPTIGKSKHQQFKTVPVKNQSIKFNHSFHQSPKLPFLLRKNQPKLNKSKQTQIIEKPFRLSEKGEPLNLLTLKTIQKRKQRQNIKKTIQVTIFQKILVKEKVKQRRIFESIHIQNYPFAEKSDEESTVNKLRKQISNMRIKKGSSFMGFHRQNVSISAMELSKELLSDIKEERASIVERTLTKYEKYINEKNVSKYMFPIISPRLIRLKRNGEQLNKTEPEDNLNEIYRRAKLRQCRNSEMVYRNVDKFS